MFLATGYAKLYRFYCFQFFENRSAPGTRGTATAARRFTDQVKKR